MNEFHNDKRVYICDRFFLGGPTSLRGFDTRGVGPHVESCALGSEVSPWEGKWGVAEAKLTDSQLKINYDQLRRANEFQVFPSSKIIKKKINEAHFFMITPISGI